MKFKIGQVVLFNNTKSLFGKLITFYNQTTYGESKTTHAGIIAEVNDKILIFESASMSGFKPYSYEKEFLEEKIKNGEIIISTPRVKVKNVKECCNNYRNIRYAILDIVAIALYWATGFKIKMTRSTKLICSEAVVRVLFDASQKKIDFTKEFHKPYDLITPADIYYSSQMKNSDESGLKRIAKFVKNK